MRALANPIHRVFRVDDDREGHQQGIDPSLLYHICLLQAPSLSRAQPHREGLASSRPISGEVNTGPKRRAFRQQRHYRKERTVDGHRVELVHDSHDRLLHRIVPQPDHTQLSK